MIRRIIEISSGGARLSIAHRQLVIARDGAAPATIPAEDIGVLIVDHPAVIYTHGVFTALTEAGAVVVLCGPDHLPQSVLMPFAGNATQTETYRKQIEASEPTRKRMWQAIIAAKLRQQAAVLDAVAGGDVGLGAMAGRVGSGDPDNLEAQGAQRYWPRLLGAEFRRGRDGPPPNNLLNYGYMVLRSGVARALVSAGLLPTLGVEHRHRNNPFCLADDAMEPYRPFVDLKVESLLRGAGGKASADIGRPEKQALLSIFNETIRVGGRRTPLALALHATAASIARSFQEGRVKLALPSGLFVMPQDAEEKEDASEPDGSVLDSGGGSPGDPGDAPAGPGDSRSA